MAEKLKLPKVVDRSASPIPFPSKGYFLDKYPFPFGVSADQHKYNPAIPLAINSFDSFKKNLDRSSAWEQLGDAMYQHSSIFHHSGKLADLVFPLGVAFFYGYKKDDIQMVGIDLAVYNIQKIPSNPMVLALPMEKEFGTKKWNVLDCGKNGPFCALETVLLGRESELLLKLFSEEKEPYNTEKIIDSFLYKWPELPIF